MKEVSDKYLQLLWEAFQYDIEVLSQPWMYYWLLIPAIGYLIFFFCKWIVLTTPIWIAPFMILQSLKKTGKRKEKK
ncbi:MAG: hypothetical protein WBA74_20995 [Cyclobacteriaceae bacterium]